MKGGHSLGVHGPCLWEAGVTVCLQCLKKQTWERKGQMSPSKWQSWDLNSCPNVLDGWVGCLILSQSGGLGHILRPAPLS